MGADLLIANLLRIAAEDLEAARLLAAHGNRNAVYCCQQAAEKTIRAVLTAEGLHAGIRHDLAEMVDLVPDANPLKDRLRDVEELGAFATTFRYPTPSGRIPSVPTFEDLSRRILAVETLLRAAVAGFGVELEAVGRPAASPSPLR